MKKTLYSIIIALGLLYSFTPFVVRAQTPCPSGQYCLLEPLQIGDQVFSEFSENTTIGGYVNIMFKIIIGIVGVLAVVMLVLGGVQYMSTDAISGKESGKETIQHALGGLILALGAFVILNTINPNILNLNIGITPITISVGNDDPPQIKNTSKNQDGTGGSVANICGNQYLNGVAITDQMPWPADTYERDKLLYITTTTPGNPYPVVTKTATGIAINKPNCTKAVDKNQHPNDPALSCTTLYDLPESTINALLSIKTKCDSTNGGINKCAMTITGGTECWLHSTHGPNLVPVDISATSSFNYYVSGQTTFPNNGKDYAKDGHTYLAEKAGQTGNTTGAHWHMKN